MILTIMFIIIMLGCIYVMLSVWKEAKISARLNKDKQTEIIRMRKMNDIRNENDLLREISDF